MLAERGIIPADWPVRVKVFRRSWRRASMTENGHRRDMHLPNRLPDSAMAQEGKTLHKSVIAGYSPASQRMLKLATLRLSS
ncbi:hypothetical protein EC2722950_3229 [Escherichia coli 2722950]|nr:hypothetical protein EC2722950_3229 [Escherichia coli 2722950]